MLKRFTLLFVFLLSLITVSAQSEVVLRGETYKVDTLSHVYVGPGTTQTSLILHGSLKLRVFYLTVDLTDPTVSIHAVCATDMVAGKETVASMAKRKSSSGNNYYCGINADFFTTSGEAANGTSRVGTPTTSCIVDGEFYKTSNSNKQFAIDENGIPYVGQAYYYDGKAACGDNQVLFKGVNVNSPNNGITIYTYKYYGVTNQTDKADACAEVTAKLVDGETMAPGKTWKMEVTGEVQTTGNSTIPDNGYVIHGRGTSTKGGTMGALDFVSGLKVGDIVEFTSIVTIDGEQIVPVQMIGGNPRILGAGEILDTESERGDASSLHPRTSIGYTADKKKLIMLVVDGRSGISQGLNTSAVGALMKYAGASDAINVDGGGSSTLYTQALGVRNDPSDGNERADGNAIFAVTNAPDDNEIAQIRFVDWAMKFPKYGVYQPKFYGYNKYGILIDTDLQGVVLSCPEALGEIRDLNTFVGTGSGTHALTGTYNGISATIPVTIVDASVVAARMDTIIHDSYRKYAIEVEASMNESMMPIAANALSWSSDNTDVLSIDANTGEITSHKDGEAKVTGIIGSSSVSSVVKVQIPTAHAMAIDPGLDTSTWTFNQSGGTMTAVEALDNGLKYTYTGNGSSRGAYIKFTKAINVWSLPDALQIRINPGNATVKNIVVSLTAGDLTKSLTITTSVAQNTENVIEYPLTEMFDTSDIMYYPVKINSIILNMGASTKDTEFTIEVPGIEAIYNAIAGVNPVIVDKADAINIYPNPVIQGETVKVVCNDNSDATIAVYTITGQLVKSLKYTAGDNEKEISTAGLQKGIYVVSVKQNDNASNTKLIVR